MKNFTKAICCISFCLAAFQLSAQDSPFNLGLKVGINMSSTSLDVKPDAEKDAKVGFVAGITAEYEFSRQFALQSGLLFTTKGMKLKGTEYAIPSGERRWTQNINMQYLQIPLTAAYKINLSSSTRLFIQAGPYIAYGIGGSNKTKIKYYDLGDKEPKEEKVNTFGKDRFKRFDFGLTGGIGVEFGDLIVGVNYEHGLIDIAPDPIDNTATVFFDQKCKNRSGSLALISVGYRF